MRTSLWRRDPPGSTSTGGRGAVSAVQPWGRRSSDRPEHRARLLEIKRQNLERLELQAAQHSATAVPLRLANEMEQLHADIATLEGATQPVEPSDEVINTLGPTGQ